MNCQIVLNCHFCIILSKKQKWLKFINSTTYARFRRRIYVLTPNSSIEQPAVYNIPACEFFLLKICNCTVVLRSRWLHSDKTTAIGSFCQTNDVKKLKPSVAVKQIFENQRSRGAAKSHRMLANHFFTTKYRLIFLRTIARVFETCWKKKPGIDDNGITKCGHRAVWLQSYPQLRLRFLRESTYRAINCFKYSSNIHLMYYSNHYHVMFLFLF